MLTMLEYDKKRKFKHQVKMWVAGAPPPPSLMKEFVKITGVEVTTAYGLTETYGPVSLHVPNESSVEKKDSGLVWQTCNTLQEEIAVVDPENMIEVPDDGETIGEVMIRGNLVMNGYLANEDATEKSFKNGWFHTGDLGVRHKNGRFQIKDRSKDIIISGGENIPSIEVENIMMKNNTIAQVAVVGMAHEKWGEVPCAFVVLKREAIVPEKEILSWCRDKMPHYYCPKRIIFLDDLPKTGTGKVQKQNFRKML